MHPSDSLAAPALLEDPRALLPAVLAQLEGASTRSAQLYPGHSSAGGCTRAAAYGVAGTPADVAYEPRASVQAWIGHAVHALVLPVMRDLLAPARIELATTWWPDTGPGGAALPAFTGHVDLYRRRSQLALDVKTVSRHQLDYVRRLGDEVGVAARPKDLRQLHANAASLDAEGKPCTWVGVLYIGTETSVDRADDEGLLWLQPVDPSITDAVVAWWAEVARYAPEPDMAPRGERGPGLSWVCDGCAWLRRCWGADAQPGVVGAQRVLAVDDEAVADALARHAEADERRAAAARAERAAKADLEFYRAILDGQDEGVYRGAGRAYELTWKPGQLRLDQGEAADALKALGMTVPRTRTRASLKVQEVTTDADSATA